MADVKVLSMSLDEIIKLKKNDDKKISGINGARGKVATYQVRPGRPAVRGHIRKRGGRLQTAFANTRGLNRHQGLNTGRGRPLTRNWNLNLNRQRQYHIALGRSKLQMAKRFLNRRQRGGARGMTQVFGNVGQPMRLSWRGMGPRLKRGRISNPRLLPNTFRSDQMLRLSRLSIYQNKLNRKLSATRHNQPATGPSLIVSIANERAGLVNTTPVLRGLRRRRGGLRGNMQQTSTFGRVPGIAYHQPNPIPYHTGALDPEIQMVIAGIQGKRKPNNLSLRRGQGSARGRGRLQRFGRTQLPIGRVENFRRPGMQLGMTGNTLNERFGGMI